MSETTSMAEAFAAESGTVPVVEQASSTLAADAPTTKSTSKFYTEDDLAKVRSQEKEKLYPQIDKLKEELDSIKRERESEVAAKAAKAAEEEAARRAALEDETDIRTLLKSKEQEWAEQLERERQERERAFALLEREKHFQELQSYKQQIIDQERDNIMPQLLKYLDGSTPEELAASAEDLKAQTDSILQDAQSAMQNARRDMRGTSVTTPPAGPLETNSEQRTFTAEDVQSMSMNDYIKNRSRLLGPAAQGKGRGLLG